MDLSTAFRDIVRQRYPALRRSLTAMEEGVINRYWGEGALVRVNFERFLASLDECAERLLAEGEPGALAEPAEPVGTVEPAEPVGTVEPVEPVDTVDVAFTLPAEVEAGTVALCGEFNDWSTDDILLERQPDRTWRTTVALEPGRSYRYRYLLDGERWENGLQADNYLPNPYGTVDSVIVVR